jgi:putative adenylate-forming enzyme
VSINRLSVLSAYAETRMAHAFLQSRADIERRQQRLWRKLTRTIAATPALQHLSGRPLSEFPIVDPVEMRARLGDWNSLGLSAEEIKAGAAAAEAGESGEVRDGVFAGFSTGSSGTRGAFLSSGEERARYMGQSLAKLLPGSLLRRRRIGLCLRANNALYRDVSRAGPFTFQYFGLAGDAAERAQEIGAFAPDIFIAPSHVLADLARRASAGTFAAPRFERLYYGAEPMGAAERDWIAGALGARPDPIYQATEGFLGAACTHGTLHLNEDSICFEFERVGVSDRHRPLVTDLRRTSQPMVRVRLDDLVQFVDGPCACGSPLRAIAPIEGRIGDVWRWGDAVVFPGDVERTISAELSPSADWRAHAASAGVTLFCSSERAEAAKIALSALLRAAGASPPIGIAPLAPESAPKRRRVQWADG